MEHLALYNELTDLPNQKYFITNLNNRLNKPVPDAQNDRVGVLQAECHMLVQIRDVYGPQFAETLTRKLAAKIHHLLPPDSFLARIERDKFGVILPVNVSHDPLKGLAEDRMAMLEKPLLGGSPSFEQEIYVDANIGAALFPDHAEDAQELMSRADLAMATARDEPGSSYRLYQPGAPTDTTKHSSVG